MSDTLTQQHQKEIAQGNRFEFGLNWSQFLKSLDEERIAEAEVSLKQMLGLTDLKGLTFLDIGSGSGLFSLAARRLGAKVHSFDYDPASVACGTELKRRYFPDDPEWAVEQGSALDQAYLKTLGQFDIVYSWGVLHHTGSMWEALANASSCVKDKGRLFVAIYNDQGGASRAWLAVKVAYNKLPKPLRFLVLGPASVRLWGPSTVKDLLRGKPFQTWRTYKKWRGMTPWRDVVDWVGGLPFEVAKPEEIIDFYKEKGYTLLTLKTQAGGLGCNEFVFVKIPPPA